MSANDVAERRVHLIEELRGFVELEASLLDRRAYREWLDLYADDGVYWLPLDPAAKDPAAQLNLIFADRRQLEDRVRRLTSGKMHAENPPSSVARVISGVRVSEDTASSWAVRSTFLMLVHRLGTSRTLGGHLLHRVRRAPSGRLEIREKRVDLLGADDPQRDLSYLP